MRERGRERERVRKKDKRSRLKKKVCSRRDVIEEDKKKALSRPPLCFYFSRESLHVSAKISQEFTPSKAVKRFLYDPHANASTQTDELSPRLTFALALFIALSSSSPFRPRSTPGRRSSATSTPRGPS